MSKIKSTKWRLFGAALWLAVVTGATAAAMTQTAAEDFILRLCRNDQGIWALVDSAEMAQAEKLGIEYEGVVCKSLIGHDLDEEVKAALLNGSLQYTLKIEALEQPYAKLTFRCERPKYSREFFFHNGKFITPAAYYTREWRRVESAHFRFVVSDSAQPHPYCVEQMEAFYARTAGVLDLNEAQSHRIAQEKIEYVLCRDEREVAKLTGFESRGMYELASDRIITHYPCHYHELVHLMVNIKLQRLPLYTHSFLQEGIAVALGGRGGIAAPVSDELGVFLHASGATDYHDLLTMKGWNETHASLSYPASGTYNRFLVQAIGINRYLALYRQFSGTSEQIAQMILVPTILPDSASWSKWITLQSSRSLIDTAGTTAGFAQVRRGAALILWQDSARYLIECRDTVLIDGDSSTAFPASRKFGEVFPEREYRGEKYLIMASKEEVQIYNLYTEELIASLVGSLRLPPVTAAVGDGRYRFLVKKEAFDGALQGRVSELLK